MFAHDLWFYTSAYLIALTSVIRYMTRDTLMDVSWCVQNPIGGYHEQDQYLNNQCCQCRQHPPARNALPVPLMTLRYSYLAPAVLLTLIRVVGILRM